MLSLRIPNGAHVLVCDGRKALFLVNHGTVPEPDFQVETAFAQPNPSTHEQGTDVPGRTYAGNDGRRGVPESTDWHDLAEHHFARDITAKLVALNAMEKLHHLVIVAPPRTLADLRKDLPTDVAKSVMAEVDKDLTKHSIPEITRLLTAENNPTP